MMNAVIDDSSIDIKKVVMMMKSLFAPETWTYKQRTEATSEVCFQIH